MIGRSLVSGQRLVAPGSLLVAVVAGAGLLIGATGCGLTSSPPRRPIEGLRTIGHEQPGRAQSTEKQGEADRLDLRLVGNE